MINQFRVEFYKLWHLKLFRRVMVFVVLFGIFGWFYAKWYLYFWPQYYSRDMSTMGNLFFESMSDTSLVFLYSMVTAWFVGIDFDNRTIHNEIAVGYSRWSVLFSRILTCWCASILLHAVTTIVFTEIGWSAYGYGFHVPKLGMRDFVWFGVILLQLMAMQSLVVLVTIFSVNAATALVVSGAFSFLIHEVHVYFLSRGMEKGLRIWGTMFFTLAQDNSDGTLIAAGFMAVAAIVGLTAASYLIFRKMELK